MSQKSRFIIGQPRDLTKWIALLSRFNNGHPLKKEIVLNDKKLLNDLRIEQTKLKSIVSSII